MYRRFCDCWHPLFESSLSQRLWMYLLDRIRPSLKGPILPTVVDRRGGAIGIGKGSKYAANEACLLLIAHHSLRMQEAAPRGRGAWLGAPDTAALGPGSLSEK